MSANEPLAMPVAGDMRPAVPDVTRALKADG